MERDPPGTADMPAEMPPPEHPPPETAPPASPSPLVVLGWAAFAAHVGVGLTFYLAAGLVAPLPGVLVLWACWIGLTVAGLRVRKARPWWFVALPVVSVGVWVLVVSLGSWVFGWTA